MHKRKRVNVDSDIEEQRSDPDTATHRSNSFQLLKTDVQLDTLPTDTILLHACNSLGVWGSGIAAVLSKKYPQAYKVYRDHCASRGSQALPGTCLLIPPQTDSDVWIACLFTSLGYGTKTKDQPGKDTPSRILANTEAAARHFVTQLGELEDNMVSNSKPEHTNEELQAFRCPKMEVYSPRINSGRFHVPWRRTEAKLVEVMTGWEGSWYLMDHS